MVGNLRTTDTVGQKDTNLVSHLAFALWMRQAQVLRASQWYLVEVMVKSLFIRCWNLKTRHGVIVKN